MIEGEIRIGDSLVLPEDLFVGEELVVVSGFSAEKEGGAALLHHRDSTARVVEGAGDPGIEALR